MSISAVGFLFRDNSSVTPFGDKNYTCVIHKKAYDGSFKKDTIISPVNKSENIEYVSPAVMKYDVFESVSAITDSKDSKFVGAAIKDGNKETEIHSLLSDKIFAVRTKDETGKNKFRLLGQKGTQKVLENNLNLNA